ncbi:unnamed protein product [Linum trigynum]|uniref:Uncharacterized protein n=1 Tax=Linum trigynum TaxID=586398 RepID=A0AAV2EBX0_9ROSI
MIAGNHRASPQWDPLQPTWWVARRRKTRHKGYHRRSSRRRPRGREDEYKIPCGGSGHAKTAAPVSASNDRELEMGTDSPPARRMDYWLPRENSPEIKKNMEGGDDSFLTTRCREVQTYNF